MWPRGLGGAPGLVSSFPGSGLEQASRAVGGGVEVWLAWVRERGLKDLENVCPYCWACCPREPGLALMDEKVMLLRLDPGKGHYPLLPIISQIRELQPPAHSPQHREALCTPGFPCVALCGWVAFWGKLLFPRAKCPQLCCPLALLTCLLSSARDPDGRPKRLCYVSTKLLAGTSHWSLFLPPGWRPLRRTTLHRHGSPSKAVTTWLDSTTASMGT